MDDGQGRFTQGEKDALEKNALKLGRAPEASGIFKVGETLVIRGSKFRVLRISTRGIKLDLLKR